MTRSADSESTKGHSVLKLLTDILRQNNLWPLKPNWTLCSILTTLITHVLFVTRDRQESELLSTTLVQASAHYLPLSVNVGRPNQV